MSSLIYKYPLQTNARQKAWVRFKQLDFDINPSQDMRLDVTGGDAVYLFMPGSFEISDGANYADADLGTAGRVVESGIQNGAFSANNVGDRINEVLELGGAGLSEVVEGGTAFASGQQINPALISKVLQRFNLEGTSLGQAVQSGLKMTANPHARAIFQNVAMRKFTFNFDLVPNNQREAKHIEQIVKFFRSNLYPEIANDSVTEDHQDYGLDMVYKFPSMLKVDMFYELDGRTLEAIDSQNADIRQESTDVWEVPYADPVDRIKTGQVDEGLFGEGQGSSLVRVGPKTLPMYITNVTTTLDGNGSMAWRSDGRPLSTKISISVQEDRTLTKSQILKGF